LRLSKSRIYALIGEQFLVVVGVGKVLLGEGDEGLDAHLRMKIAGIALPDTYFFLREMEDTIPLLHLCRREDLVRKGVLGDAH
jgi:hypothetical protein